MSADGSPLRDDQRVDLRGPMGRTAKANAGIPREAPPRFVDDRSATDGGLVVDEQPQLRGRVVQPPLARYWVAQRPDPRRVLPRGSVIRFLEPGREPELLPLGRQI